MTASILQEVQVSGSASVTSHSAALPSAVTTASTIHSIGGQTLNSSVSYTFSDNNQGSQSYTALDNYWEPNNGSGIAHAYIPNHPAGSTTCTVAYSSASSYSAAWFREVGGVATAPLDGHGTFTSHDSTTLSGTVSNSNQPAIISAVCYADRHVRNAGCPGLGLRRVDRRRRVLASKHQHDGLQHGLVRYRGCQRP